MSKKHENAQDTLFALEYGVNSGGYQLSPLEKRVAAAVKRIMDSRPDDFLAPAFGELAMDLARNITLGNMKGRAVANEAQQLAAVLDQLQGDTTEEDSSHLPSAVVDFVAAMKQPPTPPSIEAVS